MEIRPGARIHLNRSLSVRVDSSASRIAIGRLPPKARRIERPPAYLPMALERLSSPLAVADLFREVRAAFPDCDPLEFQVVMHELLRRGVLRLESPEGRYHRHELYFEFFDVAPGRYSEDLERKTVGIVGSGGIGSTVALLLATAGVGTLVMSDGDRVEESNLTRSILFDEGDIGEKKVGRARDHLEARNGHVHVVPVDRQFDGPTMLTEHFGECDIWLVSADSPAEVHAWTDEASRTLGIPYLNAGYVEVFGSIGPLVIPGRTPCHRCSVLWGDESEPESRELNGRLQAPSYGPLNALAASIAANELIRYLLGLGVRTIGTRLLIDSATYALSAFPKKPHPSCGCGSADARPSPRRDRFEPVARLYEQSRETSSMNARVLDELLLRTVREGQSGTDGLEILDLGCGIGTMSIALAESGHSVTAIDMSPGMLDVFRRRVPASLERRITIIEGDVTEVPWRGSFDRILLNLVLDHVEEPAPLIAACRRSLRPEGKLVVVLPHPFKDAGHWKKTWAGRRWEYEHLVVEDYFREGPIAKSREDDAGNTVIDKVVSFRRTLSTYYGMMTRAGLSVDEVLEPQPLGSDDGSANWAKTSKIPYFLVLCCSRPESGGAMRPMLETPDHVRAMSYPEFVAFIGQANCPPRGEKTVEDWVEMAAMTADSRLLDLACSTGFSSRAVHRRVGCRALGVDCSRPAVSEARRRAAREGEACRLAYLVADAARLPFPNGSFSHVVAGGCFGFLRERDRVLDECRSVLRDRGYLCVSNFFYRRVPPPRLLEAVGRAIGYSPTGERTRDYWMRFFTRRFELVEERLYELSVEDPGLVIASVHAAVLSAENVAEYAGSVRLACIDRAVSIRLTLNEHRHYQSVSVCAWRARS